MRLAPLLVLLLAAAPKREPSACDACDKADARRGIRYALLKTAARSDLPVMTRRCISSLAKCKDFAEAKHALAFNFGRTAIRSHSDGNCILLHCPETSGPQALVDDAEFDYYTSYPDPSAGNETVSCVEDVGLFAFVTEKKNFTDARAACQKTFGHLAEVTSEKRTRHLASLIGDLLVYVGLSNIGTPRVWKNEFGERLACFDYRAWAPGEPSHSRGCVGLQSGGPRKEAVWKVTSCSRELPFICEIPRRIEAKAAGRAPRGPGSRDTAERTRVQ